MLRTFTSLCLVLLLVSSSLAADWPTHRANAERTGSLDGVAGPKAPQVLWVHKSQEHFVASPVLAEGRLYIAGLGAFNTAAFRAFTTDAAAAKRELWSKSTPYLKLPTVSSPAIADGKLVFGDGMHQTEGAVLHCLRSDTGMPLWQLPVAGALVHLEGAPAIAGGKVYTGAGGGGVLCVDMNQVTLDGKVQDLKTVQAALDAHWKVLVEKYEKEKKEDPDFAIPPSEDALPKPRPKLLWQKGANNEWHVDAPISVVGERVLAASAFLDEEKVGKRALMCIKAGDGSIEWSVPLKYNPWAGATVIGDTVLIGSSSIRFDPKLIPVGKGEIVAVSLDSGAVKWREQIPGGIVSSVAAASAEKLAIFAATDGKLRALSLADGANKWTYDAGAPFFAAPAVVAGVAYAADLKGVVHAVRLADGQPVWKLDLPADAAIRSPGMVYGSPIVDAGRIYLATCNLEGSGVRQPTVVVCLGDK